MVHHTGKFLPSSLLFMDKAENAWMGQAQGLLSPGRQQWRKKCVITWAPVADFKNILQ